MKLTTHTHASSVFWPHFSVSTFTISSLAVFTVANSYAAPAKPRTLAFSVAAKLVSQGGEEGQTINSKVWTKGNKTRIETGLGGRPMVFLISPSYTYKLIPSAKAGVRWKNTQASQPGGGSLDLQALLRNPLQIRSMLKSKGAKFEGASKMGNTPVDVFVVPMAAGKGGSKSRAYSAKGWLRKSDSLPLRLDIVNNAFSAELTWRDYKRDVALADTLFAAPAGYKIRDAEGGPSLLGF